MVTAKTMNKKAEKTKVLTNKLTLDCTQPAEDFIMDLSNITKFLKDCIKVEGKVNNLKPAVAVEDAKKWIVVNTNIDFSKRYIKYLTKKYLKKNNFRD